MQPSLTLHLPRLQGRKTPDQHVEQLDFILIKERLHEGLCLLHLLSDLVHVTDMLYVSYKARSAEDLQVGG